MNNNKKLLIDVCIPAFNEEKNIVRILDAYLLQRQDRVIINSIVVVSSGSVDKTNEIVKSYIDTDPRISLIIEPERNGKASAINLFLQNASCEVVVLQSADTLPEELTIERLCEPFLEDEEIGMTGGAPIPVNDGQNFTGYVVHAWWWFHRHIPRFGELIAFRNIIRKIPITSSVDEAYIQAKFIQMGYRVKHVDSAIIRNKGAETVQDIIKQRRRILNGHIRLYENEKVRIQNMTKSGLYLLFFKYQIKNFRELVWLTGGLLIEVWVNLLGRYDLYIKGRNPYIWEMAKSTKLLYSEKLEVASKKITVVVGIPTYNAEASIASLIKSILSQEQRTFNLEKILVYSDRSTDATVEQAMSVDSKKVFVIDADKRKGFAEGVKFLCNSFSDDVLVILNDDILIKDVSFLEKLLQPFRLSSEVGFVCGNPVGLPARNIIEKALLTRLKASEDLAKQVNNGSNVFACDGKIMALGRRFIDNLAFPLDNGLMGNVDAYLYFCCRVQKLVYVTVYDAIAYCLSPSTIPDYVKWLSRNNKNRELLKKQFDSSLVELEYKKPVRLFVWTLLVQSIKDPVGALVILLVEPLVFLSGKRDRKFNPLWEVIASSKK